MAGTQEEHEEAKEPDLQLLAEEAADLLPLEAEADLATDALFERDLMANVDLVSTGLASALLAAETAVVDPLLWADLAADDGFATEDDFAFEEGVAKAEADFAREDLLPVAEPKEVAVVLLGVDPEYPLLELLLTVCPTEEPDTGDDDAEAEPEVLLLPPLLAPDNDTAETPEVASDAIDALPFAWGPERLAPLAPLALALAPDCELPLGFEDPETFLLLLMTTRFWKV